MSKKKRMSAFTLIEMIVTLVLIGILASFIAPKIINLKEEAVKAKTKALYESFAAGVEKAAWMHIVQSKSQTIDYDGDGKKDLCFSAEGNYPLGGIVSNQSYILSQSNYGMTAGTDACKAIFLAVLKSDELDFDNSSVPSVIDSKSECGPNPDSLCVVSDGDNKSFSCRYFWPIDENSAISGFDYYIENNKPFFVLYYIDRSEMAETQDTWGLEPDTLVLYGTDISGVLNVKGARDKLWANTQGYTDEELESLGGMIDLSHDILAIKNQYSLEQLATLRPKAKAYMHMNNRQISDITKSFDEYAAKNNLQQGEIEETHQFINEYFAND